MNLRLNTNGYPLTKSGRNLILGDVIYPATSYIVYIQDALIGYNIALDDGTKLYINFTDRVIVSGNVLCNEAQKRNKYREWLNSIVNIPPG